MYLNTVLLEVFCSLEFKTSSTIYHAIENVVISIQAYEYDVSLDNSYSGACRLRVIYRDYLYSRTYFV